MKDTLIFGFFIIFSIILALSACEVGQQRVDNWERETGRYGEGLR